MPEPTHPALKDRWTRADVKRIARRILGPNARVWSTTGRVYMGLATPSGGRVVVAAGSTWQELIDSALVKPLGALERAREAGKLDGLIAPTVETAPSAED